MAKKKKLHKNANRYSYSCYVCGDDIAKGEGRVSNYHQNSIAKHQTCKHIYKNGILVLKKNI